MHWRWILIGKSLPQSTSAKFEDLTIISFNSLERIQGYLDIEHEPEPTKSGQPPASWPTSGEIRVDGLSARYSKVSDQRILAIHNSLNFPVVWPKCFARSVFPYLVWSANRRWYVFYQLLTNCLLNPD